MKVRQINRLLFLFLIFSCYLVKLSAQDKSNPKETFSEAESFFLFEEYLDALPLYIKLKDEFPNNYNLDYKIGRCYLNMPYEKTKAITFLETAVDNISIVSRDNTLKEQKAPLDALFYLGDAYRINNQLERAIQTYNDFKKRTTDKIFDFTLVDDEIKACRLALILEKRPVTVVAVNLGEIVNTRFSESNPVVTPDETMIVYAAKLPFYQAMFYSKRENGRWSTPVNMIPELGIDGDCFPTSISPDGTELYLYRSNEYLGDLYVTNFKNGKWGKIRKLNGNINTKYWESHACISSDGKTLYFTSNRKGGYGGLDIYKTTRASTTNDDWGPAQNLGPVINSSYNDDTPFITADGKRLYFSSFGHETMGGYDIFYSDFNADGTWGKPVNMGYPVNTPDDELFFNPLKNGSIAYVAKYDSKGYGKFDIFRLELANDRPQKYFVAGKINLPGNKIGNVYLALYDKVMKDTVLRLTANSDDFSFEAFSGDYDLFVTSGGCKTQSFAINIPKDYKNKNVTLTGSLQASDNTANASQIATVNQSQKPSEINIASANSSQSKKLSEESKDQKSIGEKQNQKADTNSLHISQQPVVMSGTDKKSGISASSGSWIAVKLPYLAISGLALLSLVFIFAIIKRRRKKERNS